MAELDITFIMAYAISFVVIYMSSFFVLLFLERRHEFHLAPSNARPGWRPFISVIIPAYNEEASIAATIKSVLNSDYPKNKLEIIVVSDGSTDRTTEIAEGFRSKVVRVFPKKNTGKADSLNFGIRKAKGEIIATLDADSFVTKDAIKKMLLHFDSSDVAAVTAAVKVHKPENALQRIQHVEYLFTIFSRKILSFVDSVHVTPGPLSLFRASVFAEIGGFDVDNILEDQEIALRIQSANYKIRSTVDAVVYTNAPSTMKSFFKQRIRWHRGGIRNSMKYLNLISPKYGDLGVFILPLSTLAVLMTVVVLLITWLFYFQSRSYVSTLGLELIIFSFSPAHIFGILVFAFTLFWTYIGIRELRAEKVSFMSVIIYSVSYSYLITIFLLIGLYKEITGAKLKW